MPSEPSDHERIDTLTAAVLACDEEITRVAREVDGLHKSMVHRAAIEQAKGVIMHSMGCGPEAAFAVLVAASQRENRKLSDIAEEVTASQGQPDDRS